MCTTPIFLNIYPFENEHIVDVQYFNKNKMKKTIDYYTIYYIALIVIYLAMTIYILGFAFASNSEVEYAKKYTDYEYHLVKKRLFHLQKEQDSLLIIKDSLIKELQTINPHN